MCIMDETAEKTMTKPNLLDCDASELASYLLSHRFQDDTMATASFLLQCTSTLPNAEAISAQLMGGDDEAEEKQDEEAAGSDLGDALIEPCSISMTAPRGKFQCVVHARGMHFVNAKGDALIVAAGAVQRAVMFPKPEDCRKSSGASGGMVLLCFEKDSGAEFNGKSLTQVCFQLPANPPLKHDSSSSSWLEVLCTSLQLDSRNDVAVVQNPNRPNEQSRYTFRSYSAGDTSTTTDNMPFVRCYQGVKDGVLYPLEEGLLFFKPPMFLHRSNLHSIACGRGSGGSRYVDMALTLDDEKELEFTNIHREELSGLNSYIHSILIPAMKSDANDDGTENLNGDDDSNEEAATEEEMDESSGKRKRTQRKASREAREATRAQLDRHEETDSEDEELWEGNQDEEESEGDDEADDDEDEEEGIGLEEESSRKRQKTQRKASRDAREATRAELDRCDEMDSDEDEEPWEGEQGSEASEDDEDEDGDEGSEVEKHIGTAEAVAVDVVADDEEEEFFEDDPDFGTATESDD